MERAGGTYVDVSDWLCAPLVCPVVVGDVLVYRDDNHITTTWARTVAPLLTQRIAAALPAPARGLPPEAPAPSRSSVSTAG